MGCHPENDSCDTAKGSCDTGSDKGGDCCTFAEDMVCLAECAKEELIREKMKKVLEARIGKKLDKVAELAVDAFLGCIQHDMAGKAACDKYKEDVIAVLKG